MGSEKVPLPGRLIVGVLWNRTEDLEDAERRIREVFGPINRRSEPVPFGQYTHYYEPEMGEELCRCFWSFSSPFQRGSLVEAKLTTNRIERLTAKAGCRAVNLDPGLLTPEALNLATTKPYYHRIYISKGIFGELALLYRKGSYEPLPWTYPDYCETWAIEFFQAVREEMMEKRKAGRGSKEERRR